MYNKVSAYNLDSYIKNFIINFHIKNGLQLYFFLQTIMTLSPNKLYKPNELNKMISTNFKNLIPNLRI